MSRSLLQNVYLFKTLSPQELDALGSLAQAQTYHTGDSIFLKGEPAKALFLIKFGSVAIQQSTKAGDSIDVARLGTGSHFGEMAFVDGEPRSASAMATEPTEVVVISYERLDQFMKQHKDAAVKIYREMSHFLCGRLRMTTNDLNFAREKNLSHF